MNNKASTHVLSLMTLKMLNVLRMRDNGDYTNFYKLKDDDLCKIVLLNNACSFKNDAYVYYNTINKDIIIDYIVGGIGNERNKFYDVYDDHNHHIHLVLFLDEIIISEYKDDGSKFMIGNSDAVYKIKKFIELFMILYYGNHVFGGELISTSLGNNIRGVPLLLASIIVNFFNKITVHDVEGNGMEYEDILSIINNNDLSLDDIVIGIKQRE